MTDDEIRLRLEERQGAAEIRDQLQTQIDEISTELKAELIARNVRTLDPGGDFLPLLVFQERKTLDKLKLLNLGVPADTIAAATTVTPSEILRVNKRGQGKSTGNGNG